MHHAHAKRNRQKESAMRIELQPGALRLARGQTLRVTDALGSTIRCAEGSVWITEENVPKDVVLEAGASYRLSRQGLALVHAFGDATVALA
jgi:hypothetical protein